MTALHEPINRPDLSPGRDDAQLRQATLAAVRQELSAPVAAILGFAEMLLEDAARPALAEFAADLRRIHDAGAQLEGFVNRLLAGGEGWASMSEEAFRALIRHDLRNPINAVKGYAEMMLETAEERGLDEFAGDLRRLVAASDALLARIEEVVAFETASPECGPLAGLEILKESLLPEVVSALSPQAKPAREEIPHGRILVADDNEANRELLRRRLERDGHQVVTVENGARALAVACTQAFDLILLDIMMPKMSGYEVCERLKQNPASKNIPILMVTALNEMGDIEKAVKAGADDFLTKPVHRLELTTRVRSLLRVRHLTNERDRLLAYIEEVEAGDKP